MAASYSKSKGRGRGTGQYMAIPYAVLEHENYIRMSASAKALLIDIFVQFNGKNNGKLICSWHYMRCKRGWRSQQTLNLAKAELVHYGFVLCTEQGGLGAYSRYGITWLRIDEAKDISVFNTYVTTKVVPSLWRDKKEAFNKKDYMRLHKQERVKKPQGTVTPFRKRRAKRTSKSEPKK